MPPILENLGQALRFVCVGFWLQLRAAVAVLRLLFAQARLVVLRGQSAELHYQGHWASRHGGYTLHIGGAPLCQEMLLHNDWVAVDRGGSFTYTHPRCSAIVYQTDAGFFWSLPPERKFPLTNISTISFLMTMGDKEPHNDPTGG